MIILLAVLALLVVGGGATTVFLLGRGSGTPSTASAPTPTESVPASEAAPSEDVAATPTPESSTDARFVKEGQCVKNESGSGDKPKLAITSCTPKTYEVLKRVDGATNGKNDAVAKCSGVAGYTDWYFFNSELDVLDFVLCLKLR
ncbi:hypothetical protein [Plantactinospora sp. GCM10030261]|uniref:LppU/SCO3897 family protein n=1 Tax=Plantactinospora sp. GCM10030261 TaxID=3273420 RepID=UPI003610DD54